MCLGAFGFLSATGRVLCRIQLNSKNYYRYEVPLNSYPETLSDDTGKLLQVNRRTDDFEIFCTVRHHTAGARCVVPLHGYADDVICPL